MNLEELSAEKQIHLFPKFSPKATQASLFPFLGHPEKKLPRPAIEKVLHQIEAKRLCGHEQVEAYLRGQLRHNCRPNTIRSSASAMLLFLDYLRTSSCDSLSAIKDKTPRYQNFKKLLLHLNWLKLEGSI